MEKYLNGKKWNEKGYKEKGEIEYEIINGNGNKYKSKEFIPFRILKFADKNIEGVSYEVEYINGVKNGKGKS